MSKYPIMAYIQKAIKKSPFHSVNHVCERNGLNYDNVSHYLRSEYKFELHTFMALVEILELDVMEFYGIVYKADREKGRI